MSTSNAGYDGSVKLQHLPEATIKRKRTSGVRMGRAGWTKSTGHRVPGKENKNNFLISNITHKHTHTHTHARTHARTHAHTHTHTRAFNGPLSGTTQVSRYQKSKTNLDFTGARDNEWQWHQLGHMQVCTSLQTDNHTSTPPLSFYRPDALPAAQPTASKH